MSNAARDSRPVDPRARRARAEIDVGAIADNVARLAALAADAEVMAVVKADAYGHGLVESARAARSGGATWLGVALLEEALALRGAGDSGRVLAWLLVPDDDWGAAVESDIDVSVNAVWAVDSVTAAARAAGRTARVHICVDTGLAREGAAEAEWAALFDAVADAKAEGLVEPVAIWSHLAYADAPGHPTIELQRGAFERAVQLASTRGLPGLQRHLANSAATLTRPDLHFDIVRPGVAVYGLTPGLDVGEAEAFGLRPAMKLVAEIALVKDAPAGQGVSYAHTYTTTQPTTLALVPVGYSDGVPRASSNAGPVRIAGRNFAISGRVCMDQFVVDVGDHAVKAGDEVVIIGDPARGEPGAEQWAAVSGTIGYEIVTRIAGRLPRVYVGGSDGA